MYVRLVQEFCGLRSLRAALKGGKQFRGGDADVFVQAHCCWWWCVTLHIEQLHGALKAASSLGLQQQICLCETVAPLQPKGPQ
jgi:hypothetical protein